MVHTNPFFCGDKIYLLFFGHPTEARSKVVRRFDPMRSATHTRRRRRPLRLPRGTLCPLPSAPAPLHCTKYPQPIPRTCHLPAPPTGWPMAELTCIVCAYQGHAWLSSTLPQRAPSLFSSRPPWGSTNTRILHDRQWK